MVFSFHRSKKRPNAWCNCSKTKNYAKKSEAKVARLCARNFCLRATSSSTSISLARFKQTVSANGALKIRLASLGQFARLRDVRLCLVALEHAIEEPNNETVHQQNERAYDSRMMPNVTHFEGNQGRCRKYH